VAGDATPEPQPQQVLTDEILADARRQADRIRRKAERDAKDTVQAVEKDAQADRERRLADARDEADRRRRLTLATVPVEEGRLWAARIEEALESVRAEARDRLARRDGFDYRQALVALADEAVEGMGAEAVVLELGASDRGTLGPDLAVAIGERIGPDGPAVSLAPEPATGATGAAGATEAAAEAGVVVRDADGRRRWDNSFAARLARLWPDLRRRIAAESGLLDERQNDNAE